MSGVGDSNTGRTLLSPAIISRDFSLSPSNGSNPQQPATPRGHASEHDITSNPAETSTPVSGYQFPRMLSSVRQAFINTTPARAPQFAEEFTPLAQKSKKRNSNRSRDHQVPVPIAGSSQAGWFDADEGDLYRGASAHPGALDGFSKPPEKAGDTASVKSASSSSSSLSGLELGRRVTQAIDKVGDALHLRRGSASSADTKTDTLTTITTRDSSSSTSTSDSDSSSSSSSSDDGATSSGIFRRRKHRRRTARSKTASRRSQSPDALSTGTMRRRQIPTRREFTLMLPRPIGEDDISETTLAEIQPSTARVRIALPPSANESLYSGPIGVSPLDQPNHDWHGRLITTPALKAVIDRIREERQKSGYEAAFQAETEKREARERRKRKRRSHHQHGSRMTAGEGNPGPSRQSSEEGRRSGQSQEDGLEPTTRKRATRNRLEQLRSSRENHKVRFDDGSESLPRQNFSEVALSELRARHRYSDPGTAEGDIIRPKSAADLLGLKETLASSSSTSLKSMSNVNAARPMPKRGHPFKLPPRPVFNRAHTVIGPASVFAKAAVAKEDAMEVKKGCWWLDVSCPTWEDLRDLGEVSIFLYSNSKTSNSRVLKAFALASSDSRRRLTTGSSRKD
jgi:magnesium transporter